MIKISSGKNKSINDLKEEFYNLLNPKNKNGLYHKTNSIHGRLLNLINSKKRSIYIKYYNYLSANLKAIITNEPQTLLKHFEKLRKISKKHKLKLQMLNSDLSTVFNYESFRSGKVAKWLIEELDITTCPYCNRQYIFFIREGDKSKLFNDFDHYFTKSKYIILSLSFYNLIPCCSSCNSRTKHATIFSLSNYLHPYFDSFNDILTFSTDIKNSKIFFDNPCDIKIGFVNNILKKPTQDDVKRARKTAAIFRLEPLYNKHKDIIRELLQKNMTYNETYINDLLRNNSKIFKDRADIYKMIIGNYVADNEIHKRPLAKFMKDIANEFKLLPLNL